jgi:site-specific DNA-methyltransferase (adenine-specific)
MMVATVSLLPGDNRESLRRLIDDGVRVHSVVTDPPYGLVSVVKRFGGKNAAPAKYGTDGAFARASRGFMHLNWDGTGIERDPEFWKLIYDILLPGGFVFAFSGSRTGHWQACAMETAGFVMHPMHGWVTHQGFPKAHDAAKAIDKMLGAEGGFVPEGNPVKRLIPGADVIATGDWAKTNGRMYQPGEYQPGSPEAQAWDGWAYGTQSQKPALEPIYLGQKPFSEKTGAANLLKHGVGAFNIDGCRVPTSDALGGGAYAQNPTERKQMWGDEAKKAWKRGGAGDFVQPEGRWPANLILDGSPEVVDLFPESSVTGKRSERSKSAIVDGTNWLPNNHESAEYADSGSAARFYHNFPPDPIICHPKAGKADRAGGTHPTVKPIALMQYLIRHITPPGGTVLDPFAGSGTTGEAAKREGFNCILMEAEPKYVEFLNSRFELHQEVDDSQLVDSRQNDLQLGGDKEILNWLLSQI